MSKTTILEKENAMYQIKVNGILQPTIYWSLADAINACKYEAERGVAVITEVVILY